MSAERTRPSPALVVCLGAGLVFVLRLMLSLADPDLVHPVDPAELGHLDLLPAFFEGGTGAVGRMLGAADNVHHGGFIWLSIPVGLLRWLTGSDLLAVRGTAAGMAALAWGIWVEVARRLGGRWAAVGVGVCLAVPVPWFAQWTATLWGSHSEAAVFTGLWALALARSASAARVGLLVGLGVAWDPLLWPTGLLVVGHRRERRVVLGLLAGWLLVRWPVLLAAPAGLVGASLTEDPAHTPLAVLAVWTEVGSLGSRLSAWMPLPWTAGSPAMAGGLTAAAGVVCGLAWWRGRREQLPLLRMLALVFWLHLAVVVVCSPFGGQVAHRYLVAWWPALVVVPWVMPGRVRLGAAVPLLSTAMAVPLLLSVVGQLDPSLSHRYRSADFQRLGLDRVPVHRVDGVLAFLEQHPTDRTPGFAAAFSGRWGYPVWGEPFPEQLRAAGLMDRWTTLVAHHPPTELARDFGWGLAVACDGQAACERVGVDQLEAAGAPRDGVEAGLAAARGR